MISRLPVFLLFPAVLFISCHRQPVASAPVPQRQVEVIATVEETTDRSLLGELLSPSHSGSEYDGSLFSYVLNGKTYHARELHDDYFVRGQKFIALVKDSLHPEYGAKLLFSNPVFESGEPILFKAGIVLGAWENGILYEYVVDGKRYRNELFRPGKKIVAINGGMNKNRLILVLVDPGNHARSIAVPDETPEKPDSIAMSTAASEQQTTTYGKWLARGITGADDSAFAVTKPGAYYLAPDSAEAAAALSRWFQPWQLSYTLNQRKALQEEQLNTIRSLGVPVYELHKKKLFFHLADESGVYFDCSSYQDPFVVVLFNGVSSPLVRDPYIDNRPYFYRQYFIPGQ